MTTFTLEEIPLFEKELFDEINKEANNLPMRPAGFGITITEYATESGKSWSTCKRVFRQMVASGKLKVKRMISNGRACDVFYK